MHFYGMPEAPAIPLRDRGLSGCCRLTGREQLVKAAGPPAGHEARLAPAAISADLDGWAARIGKAGGRADLVNLRGGAGSPVWWPGRVSQVSAPCNRSVTMPAMPGARFPLASCSIMRSTCSA